MKKCPVCGRAYADENVFFCLDDGATLLASSSAEKTLEYTPAPTEQITAPRASMPPPTQNFQARPFVNQTPPHQSSSSKLWMIPVAAVLIFVVLGGVVGAFFLLISRPKNSPANAQTVYGNDSTSPVNARVVATPTPALTVEKPPSSKLIGTWQADVVEQGVKTRITYTLNANGTSKMLFKSGNGQTGSDRGTWQYSDGVLYEKYSNGVSGRGAVRMIDDDAFEITIIDNGTPAYTGVKRVYRRQ